MVTRAPRRTDRKLNLIGAAVGVVCVIAAVVVVLIATSRSSKPTAPVQRTCREIGNSESPFACSSVWNAPQSANAPLSPRSSAYTAQLLSQVREYGAWISTYSYSVPVYTVGRDQRRVPVTLDASGPGSVDELAQAFKQGVPIPPGAKPAAGNDQHMVIWQPSSDTMWEFWHAQQVNGAWHARWGGKMTNVSSNPGYFSNPSDWGATATSLPLLGGLIGIRELESGHIDHALAMSIPHAATGVVAFPAQRSDGNERSPGAIPEGTRFRLDPRLDIGALHVPPVVRVLAEAAQRYGMIVRDQAGTVSLYAQDPTPLGKTPYYGPHGLLDGMSPAVLMRYFPWHDLQVVRPAKLSG
ncbi:MAG TPA: hypothetical protein VG371_12535 [Solirubrobacteraceae bacterium]|nr:hypothetical protein [Solirubrobacteraceae bacterium]